MLTTILGFMARLLSMSSLHMRECCAERVLMTVRTSVMTVDTLGTFEVCVLGLGGTRADRIVVKDCSWSSRKREPKSFKYVLNRLK
jgi:hypothetical protein